MIPASPCHSLVGRGGINAPVTLFSPCSVTLFLLPRKPIGALVSARVRSFFDLDHEIDDLLALDRADPMGNACGNTDEIALADAPRRTRRYCLPAQFSRLGFARSDQRAARDESPSTGDHVPDVINVLVNLGASCARAANDGGGIARRTDIAHQGNPVILPGRFAD